MYCVIWPKETISLAMTMKRGNNENFHRNLHKITPKATIGIEGKK